MRTISDLHLILGPGNFNRLSRISGVSTGHISRVLQGTKGVSLRVASQMADGAGISLDDLQRYIVSRPTYVDSGRMTMKERALAAA